MLKNRTIQHVLFWVVAYAATLLLVSDSTSIGKADYIYATFMLTCMVPLAYTNTAILIPLLINRKRYFAYTAAIIIAVALFCFLAAFLFIYVIDFIFPQYIFIPILNNVELTFVGFIIVSITSLLYFSKSWFYSEHERMQIAILQQQKSELELSLLKSQLNPHFLFNSLNSIYGLIIKKSDLASEAVVRLSDILRYLVYETSKEKVSLQRELEMVESYIILQKMRLNRNQQVSYTTIGDAECLNIAPMLLFTFIENAFKHCTKDKNGIYQIDASTVITNKKLIFRITNTIKQVPNDNMEYKGIGLQNAKEQLNRLYPSHSLDVERNGDIFTVRLAIELNC